MGGRKEEKSTNLDKMQHSGQCYELKSNINRPINLWLGIPST